MIARTDLAHDLVVLQNAPACDGEKSVGNHRRWPWLWVAASSARCCDGRWLGSLTDVDAVVVPVCARHILVDVRVDARHFG